MSALFRIDRFATPRTTARILDLQEGPTISAVGAFIVKVPDNIPIISPENYGDLLTQRGLGYLTIYSSFAQVVFDDLLDTTSVNVSACSQAFLGSPSQAVLLPGGVFQSSTVGLGFTTLQGTFNVTNGSAVVGTTLDQTSALAPGLGIVFASQPGVTYTVLHVSSSTVTLTANYAGVDDAQVLAFSLSALTGTFGVTHSNPNVTTTLSQENALTPGMGIIFASQSSTTYTILTVTPSTLVLTGNYTGTTAAATNAFSPPTAAPSQVLVTWDTYSTSDSDPSTGQFSRNYVEEASVPGNIACQVSFDNGTTWGTALDGTVFDVPLTNRGTLFLIQFTNNSSNKLSVGSWSLLY
jgi:hypothetical protein